MKLEYFSDQEYQRAFKEFGGLRRRISIFLQNYFEIQEGVVVDVPAGHGFMAIEAARVFPTSHILGVGLPNDCTSFQKFRENKYTDDAVLRLDYIASDATGLSIATNSCDLVINFLGLEDILMTRGEEGLLLSLTEFVRILKPGGGLQLSIVDYGDSPAEKVAQSIWDEIGLNAVFKPVQFYIQTLENLGMDILTKTTMSYPRKMTAEQAKEEIRFACNNAPETFNAFGVKCKSFEYVWSKFESIIEKHGMAFWSPILILVFQKQIG